MHDPQKHGAGAPATQECPATGMCGTPGSSSQAKTAGCVYAVMKCEVFMQRDRSKGASARTTCIQSSSLCSDCAFLSFCSIVLGFVRWCFCFMHFVYQPTRHSAQQFEERLADKELTSKKKKLPDKHIFEVANTSAVKPYANISQTLVLLSLLLYPRVQ